MKKLMIVLAVLLGLSSLAACGNNSKDSAVVTTKGGKITQDQFYKELKAKYGDQVLQEMVYDKLLKKKYNVSQKEIDKKINEVKGQFPTDAAFKSALQQNNLTEKSFKQNVEQQLLLTKATTDGVTASTKEMKDYFSKNKDKLIEVKASHILVKDKKTADAIEKKIKDGQDFATLAKKYSTDPSKDKGGDLGWFHKGDMVPEFEKKAFSMKVGDISDPVKSQYGYHIIKLTGKKDTFDELKPEIKDAVIKSKAKAPQDVLQKLVKNSDVKIKDDQFKDLFKQQPAQPSTSTQSQGTTTQQSDSSSSNSSSSDSSSK